MFDWTDERVEYLRNTWDIEGLSSTHIAAQLGITRNAVIGKVRRLGLLKRTVAQRVSRFQPPTTNNVSRPPPPLPPSAPVPSVARNLTLLELRDRGQCKWPLDNGLFCGADTDRVYCFEHEARSYNSAHKAEGKPTGFGYWKK